MLDLRWRLTYQKRLPRLGEWNDGNAPMERMSAYAPKDGIREAIIEARLPDGSIKPVIRCEGHEWEAFQVLAAASVPMFSRGTVTPVTKIIGMILYTGQKKAFILRDGRSWKEQRTDKNIVFDGWRK